jgi:hypothetical protein
MSVAVSRVHRERHTNELPLRGVHATSPPSLEANSHVAQSRETLRGYELAAISMAMSSPRSSCAADTLGGMRMALAAPAAASARFTVRGIIMRLV